MIAPALYSGPAQQLPLARNILSHIDIAHPSASLVRHLIERHPNVVSREALRQATGTAGREIALAAAFEWRLLRANDTLPNLGWKIIADNERYHLEKLNHHE